MHLSFARSLDALSILYQQLFEAQTYGSELEQRLKDADEKLQMMEEVRQSQLMYAEKLKVEARGQTTTSSSRNSDNNSSNNNNISMADAVVPASSGTARVAAISPTDLKILRLNAFIAAGEPVDYMYSTDPVADAGAHSRVSIL